MKPDRHDTPRESWWTSARPEEFTDQAVRQVRPDPRDEKRAAVAAKKASAIENLHRFDPHVDD